MPELVCWFSEFGAQAVLTPQLQGSTLFGLLGLHVNQEVIKEEK